jgi:hypothetical protein
MRKICSDNRDQLCGTRIIHRRNISESKSSGSESDMSGNDEETPTIPQCTKAGWTPQTPTWNRSLPTAMRRVNQRRMFATQDIGTLGARTIKCRSIKRPHKTGLAALSPDVRLM